MYISFSPQQQIGLANVSYQSHHHLPKNTIDNNGMSGRREAVNKGMIFGNSMGTSLGGKAKKNSMLDSLIQQKENLLESKNALIEKNLENGGNLLSIKEKLESIDKQIQEVNEQISKIHFEEQQKALNMEGKSKKTENTNQTADNDSSHWVQTDDSINKMNGVVYLSSQLSQVKALSSQKTSLSGEVRILNYEIKLDESRRVNPAAKRQKVAKIEDNIKKMDEIIGDSLKNVNTKIKDSTLTNKVDKNEESKIKNSNKNIEDTDKSLMKLAEQKYQNDSDNINNHENMNITI
ncbi:hypothetical protein [Bacillus chungangensis]|uniref:Vacuolar-type H+-ATPase subunit I/STV1 n=1 Tax=Bacillus chungangensis TaxID=587633 RepID=A0ABT9WPS2_9BACI|nr:hypothetical protein [Bacillus chungangensis]MDQ0175286.1 vacuolar-type H+-ATPase subunit I/STV1 [Bacillus chungangensis]